MAGRRHGHHGTRRVARVAAEQKDRLGEQRGSQPCGFSHPCRAVDHQEERPESPPTLVQLRPRREQSEKARGELGPGATDEDPEANLNPLLRGRAGNQESAMPVQQHQVEHSLDQPPDPLANRGARDPVAAGRRRERPAPVDLPHRSQNIA